MLISIINFLYAMLVLRLHAAYCLDYEEIKALGASCSPSDTCSIPRHPSEDNLSSQTCECKASCRKYGTCCIDTSNNLLFRPRYQTLQQASNDATCQFLYRTTETIFLQDKCKRTRRYDREIRALCEGDMQELKDPVTIVPVTSFKTAISYKNYFCALCNDDINDLVFWNIRVTQYGSSRNNISNIDEIIENLVYNDDYGQWGMVDTSLKDNTGTGDVSHEQPFRSVSISFEYPSHVSHLLTRCDATLVSDCHPNWRDEIVARKCHSYMGMIYAMQNTSYGYPKEVRFRNIHCALCNFVERDAKFKCRVQTAHAFTVPAISFNWLLDINLSSGNKVGKINRCSAGETYDPFFKKCRVMRCIKPGYKVRNRRCVPS